MKYALALLTACMLAVGAQAQDVDDIVARHIEAMGGAETLEATETTKTVGTASAQGMQFPVVTYQRSPHLVRSEVEIQGMQMIQTFDGEEGWVLNPMMGSGEPQPMPAAQVALMKQETDMSGPLLNYEAKGNTVEYTGTEEVNGKDALVLKITRPSGTSLKYYLDSATYLPVMTTTTVDAEGQTLNVAVDMGDYREVDGRMVPFSIVQKVNGMTASEMKVDSVAFNVEMPDALFSKPSN